MYILN